MKFKTGNPRQALTPSERIERARTALAAHAPAVQGEGGNAQTMRACGLLLRHGLGVDEAWPLLCAWNDRCTPPWDTEAVGGGDSLRKALEAAAEREGKGSRVSAPSVPRPALARAPAVDFVKVAEEFAAGVVGNVGLFESISPVKVEAGDIGTVAKLFDPASILSIVTEAKQDGSKWKPAGAGHLKRAADLVNGERRIVLRGFNEAAGAWVRINPMKAGTNGAGDGDVKAFRHILLESDRLPRPLQLRVINRLRLSGLPVALVVDSGSQSFHCWVRVDCSDLEGYRATAARLFALPLGFDPANRNPSRLSRFPGVRRGEQVQACLYLNPDASPLSEETLAKIEAAVGEVVAKVAPPVVEVVESVEVPAVKAEIGESMGEVVKADTASPPSPPTESKEGKTFDFTALDARRIRLECPPPVPVPVFKLAGQTISTAGNLTGIAAQAKSGKSATVGAMLASLLCATAEGVPLHEERDCLGWLAQPHKGRAVVLFDTEQSPYDSWALVQRSVDRAGLNGLPSNLRAYRLLDVPTKERRAMLSAELERASVECGGVHVVLVDGVADLCLSVNDEVEAFGLVDELVQLAVGHDCPVVCVLHENPAQPGQGGKTRGHLGSQLERKAESNLRLEKAEDGVCTIYSTRCRNGDVPKSKGVSFAWSDESKMHATVERVPADKAGAKREEHAPAVEAVFAGVTGSLSWSDLKGRIETAKVATARTAERRINTWVKLGLVTQTGDPAVYLRPVTVNRQTTVK